MLGANGVWEYWFGKYQIDIFFFNVLVERHGKECVTAADAR